MKHTKREQELGKFSSRRFLRFMPEILMGDMYAHDQFAGEYKLAKWSDRCEAISQNAQLFEGRTIAWWKARRAEHKALWNWLSKDGLRDKPEWEGWDYNKGSVYGGLADCVACVIGASTHGDSCQCPIIWTTETCQYGGLWDVWDDNSVDREEYEEDEEPEFFDKNLRARKELAAQILDLPWKFEKVLW